MAGVVKYTMTIDNETYDGEIAYTNKTEQQLQLATASTDTSISFGGVTTATVLVLKSDQALTLNVNSASGTDIAVAADRPQVFLGGSLTAAYVSNASGSTANITMVVYGT